jgi:hypothetical protein
MLRACSVLATIVAFAWRLGGRGGEGCIGLFNPLPDIIDSQAI